MKTETELQNDVVTENTNTVNEWSAFDFFTP